ncbi:hypothetical protein GUITHDRAFT_148268 [Guillardia theta CCMP2712]|uniref:Uncharacterized protein n=1 Tax=Guillardia theta (strain CCMP2712) TaxID=905079 RepID=L1IAL4_GUITC|nr:hypothetical protein GUITHDRAFT_148268 [Guillardia theta CCMP2712]EKX32954.1 hypothetical protein GUITHDRAFT_148268 [Guillardia theta CCMP2712]|eukprot:XP_005819934.1 hypothetical protein GUITHDRAFT_148268 [Guillardia theta CCMP2712]
MTWRSMMTLEPYRLAREAVLSMVRTTMSMSLSGRVWLGTWVEYACDGGECDVGVEAWVVYEVEQDQPPTNIRGCCAQDESIWVYENLAKQYDNYHIEFIMDERQFAKCDSRPDTLFKFNQSGTERVVILHLECDGSIKKHYSDKNQEHDDKIYESNLNWFELLYNLTDLILPVMDKQMDLLNRMITAFRSGASSTTTMTSVVRPIEGGAPKI